MKIYLNYIQIIVSLLLIFFILIQARGGGLSAVFGGGEFYQTRRGLEKKIFIITVILAILFLGLGVLQLIL
jgi:preprotein translocase subunit SecG